MAKSIKKIYKALFIVLAALIILPLGAWLSLRSFRVQTWLLQKISAKVAQNLETEFEIGRVEFIFFNRLSLSDVVIRDHQLDTLLYLPKVSGQLNQLDRKNRILDIEKVHIHQPKIYFKPDSTGRLNLLYITDQLRRKDTTKKPMRVHIRHIDLKDGLFAMRTPNHTSDDFGINYTDMRFGNLQIQVDSFRVQNESITFDIHKMGFIDPSGFILRDFSTSARLDSEGLRFNNVHYETFESFLQAPRIHLLYNNWGDLSDPMANVRMDIRIDTSNINTRDFGLMTGVRPQIIENISVSGRFYGILSELKGRDVLLTYRTQTMVKADFDFSGLPDMDRTFLFMEVENLQAHAADFEALRFWEPDSIDFRIPDYLYDLGLIHYHGNFTGFFDNFVSYGDLSCDLGTLSTDLSVRPDTANMLYFNGFLGGKELDIGYLTKAESVEDMWMSAEVDGHIRPGGDFRAQLTGNIDSLSILDYHYKNIELDGVFQKNAFDGSIKANEENLIMDFLGRLDFTGELPVFDFTLNLPYADLRELNLDATDSISNLNLLLTANFRGNSVDNIQGEVKLLNSRFERDDQSLEVYDFTASAFQEEDTSRLSLRTDFVDADVWGRYTFSTILTSLRNSLHPLLPSYSQTPTDTLGFSDNNFRYYVKLKDTEKLSEFIKPGLRISPDVVLQGEYRPEEGYLDVKGMADYLIIDKNRLLGLELEGGLRDSLFFFSAEAEDLLAQNMIETGNTHLYTVIKNDTIDFQLKWDKTDSTLNKGEILSQARLNRIGPSQKTHWDIDLLPTEVYIRDSLWRVQKGIIAMDANRLEFRGMGFNRNQHQFHVNGIISEDPSDTLKIELENINLNFLNFLGKKDQQEEEETNSMEYHIAGHMEGSTHLSDLYHNPLFESDIRINEFHINEQSYGDLVIGSWWDTLLRVARVEAWNQLEEKRNFSLAGFYAPERKGLQMEAKIADLNLEVFSPLLRSFASELKGRANGELKIEGSLETPEITGEVSLQESSMKINLLNTVYAFNDRLIFRKDALVFEDILLTDERGGTARFYGELRHNSFNNMEMDLHFEPRNFLVLNTSPWHNESFYGTATASGRVSIRGTEEQISLDITATTGPNTRFFIPLSSENRVSEYSFITFLEPDSLTETEKFIPLTSDAEGSSVGLNFNLNVTPDAEVQLIFDSQLGDIIRSRGEGQLNLQMPPNAPLEIYGTYTIDEGDYLFTLGNIINKRFEVESGSTLQWNGDPSDAAIDLNAIYNLKASLYDLIQDEAFRRRIPVECRLNLTNRLSDPVIGFDIALPTTDEETRSYLQNAVNTEEEMSRQFLSLLVINSFYADPNIAGVSTTSSNSATALNATTSELLSNQLSNWLSQISKDVDVGFTYRPGTEISSQEVELALSTQLLNDRVSISTNVDLGGDPSVTNTSTSNITGDFIMEIKLTDNGKLRFKAFNRSNDNILYETAPYTQGVGLFYREEFNNFNQLLKQYWNRVFRKNEEENSETSDR